MTRRNPMTPSRIHRPTDPTDNPGKGDQGGSKSDDNKGGSEDSGDHGDGTGGDDGDHGGSGGDHGSGGEEDDTPPHLYDTENPAATKAELPDSKLTFVAYPLGKGDLHIRVRLKNETNSGNGLLLTSQNNQDYEAQLDFNADNLFVLSLYDGGDLSGTCSVPGGLLRESWRTIPTRRWGTIHPPSLPIWTGPAWT